MLNLLLDLIEINPFEKVNMIHKLIMVYHHEELIKLNILKKIYPSFVNLIFDQSIQVVIYFN
jgi:hypothetical protein